MANVWNIGEATASDDRYKAIYQNVVAKEIWYLGTRIWGGHGFSDSLMSLCLDVSGSMNSRLEALKLQVLAFCSGALKNYGDQRIEVISFNSNANRRCWFTRDFNTLYYATFGLTAGGGTNIAPAIGIARADFSRFIEENEDASERKKVIVVFSDGATSYKDAATEQANNAKAEGCIIITMYYGGASSFMRSIASSPDLAFSASGEDAIKKMFAALKEILSGKRTPTVSSSDGSSGGSSGGGYSGDVPPRQIIFH